VYEITEYINISIIVFFYNSLKFVLYYFERTETERELTQIDTGKHAGGVLYDI